MALLGFRRRQHGRRLACHDASMLPHTHDPWTPQCQRDPRLRPLDIQEEYLQCIGPVPSSHLAQCNMRKNNKTI
jgi:hypothetical protein